MKKVLFKGPLSLSLQLHFTGYTSISQLEDIFIKKPFKRIMIAAGYYSKELLAVQCLLNRGLNYVIVCYSVF